MRDDATTVQMLSPATATPNATTAHPWRQEFDDIVRGLAGGFLFGIPLLYTMEVWWIGAHAEPLRLLLLMLFACFVNWILGHFSGFRKGTEVHHPITDAVEALAIGVIGATITLAVLGKITIDQPLHTIAGTIALESVPFSLGVSIANGFLGDNKEQTDDEEQGSDTARLSDDKKHPHEIHGTLVDAGATIAGALFICFSIAPTEEVPMLGVHVGDWGLVALIIFSLVVSYMITFQANFANQKAREQQKGAFQDPITETIFSYLVSLLVAAVLLYLFKQVSFTDPWNVWLSRTIVLGLPAAIGGSAGRLALGG
jgi:putative integral membrane protein (TIGR02587 family)